MILSDITILKMLAEKSLSVSPLEESQIQPASIDVRLGDTFSIVEDSATGILTLDREIRYKTIHTDTYLLLPGQFVLATTMESLALPDNLTAFEEGRSSLGRLGPGFRGEITLKLFNDNRCAIELKTGRRIGQLVFAELDTSALHPYNGKYQGQTGATGSKVFLDREAKEETGDAVRDSASLT